MCVQYYGDWCSATDGFNTGCGYVSADISSFYYIYGIQILANFASILGNTGDATHYSQVAATAITTYNTLYFNATTNAYLGGVPVNQMLPLQLGIAPKGTEGAVFDVMTSWINASYAPTHNVGGIVAGKYLFPVLSAYGQTDLGIKMHLQTDFPSVGYWIANNTEPYAVSATTLWENWQSTSFNPYGRYVISYA
jgi:alpha-L-rhamnosidase